MGQLPSSIIVTIALLTTFLVLLSALKFAIEDTFVRARLIMTAFFCFIVATLTISFWDYRFESLPYSIPAFVLGVAVGYILGVRAAEERITTEGLAHYMEHFAHIHIRDVQTLTWWSVVNFYSIMSALVLINLVGLSTVLLREVPALALGTSAVGAFLLGSIVPYLFHLWSLRGRKRR